jgi:hypothetical protein
MSRRMDHTIAFDAPAEKIYQDLTSREYWQTLMEVYLKFTPSNLTSFSTSERGTDIVFVHVLPRDHLPPIARNVMPVDMVITRTQHFDPFDHATGRAEGTYSASIPRGPGSLRGEYFLEETDSGSTLRLASVCKVRIPLIGGTLEDLILNGTKDVFDAEEEFAADWISRHH